MTLDNLKASLNEFDGYSDEYVAKQLHKVPLCPVVDRTDFILSRCKGKSVLDIGASGPLHRSISASASVCYGIDRQDSKGVVGVNLDEIGVDLPLFPSVELIVCGEIIEHLGNPLYFLQRLRKAYANVPVIVTVPNAFSKITYDTISRKSIENVNIDHVAWYSWRTLSTLLQRVGYEIHERAWYNGKNNIAEGLIATVK